MKSIYKEVPCVYAFGSLNVMWNAVLLYYYQTGRCCTSWVGVRDNCNGVFTPSAGAVPPLLHSSNFRNGKKNPFCLRRSDRQSLKKCCKFWLKLAVHIYVYCSLTHVTQLPLLLSNDQCPPAVQLVTSTFQFTEVREVRGFESQRNRVKKKDNLCCCILPSQKAQERL